MSMMLNLEQHVRCVLTYSSKTRFLSSKMQSSPARNQTLQTPALDQWRRQQQGNQLNPSLVRGIVEKASQRINLRNESIYTSLLTSYERRSEKTDLGKAESTFKKMRKLGLRLRPKPYSLMTPLYSPFGNREKVDEILLEMKEINIELDSFTANKALRVYPAVTEVTKTEKASAKEKARKMLRRIENAKKEDVYTIKKYNEEFRDLISSFLKLDNIKEAKKIYYSEWACSGLEFDIRIPNMSVSAYYYVAQLRLTENVLGLEEAEKFLKIIIPDNMKVKAEAIFKKMRELGFLLRLSPFNSMISLYTEVRKPSKVQELLREMKEKNIEPDSPMINNILRVYADVTDVETIKKV
ncbi:hypothetical protein EUTSA_v10012206mg [Eutrema salsugineum]|uniref:Pentacotripeptide-repeat region of PRORP domain-containing protein n=1 Tax=Eutrema salsugineum TaxID=72664 RepID=V4KI81_EUTSA|nr:hypothetical protein EUTSA_v10012206mg [Eutrema salsugineum]